MTNIKKFVLLLSFSTCALICSAVTIDGFSYVLNDDHTATLEFAPQDRTSIIIPETIEVEGETYIVNKVGHRIFFDNKSLEEIQLPNTIKIIDDSAFAQCDNLIDINFPSGLERIEDSAFRYCMSFQKVELPNTLQYLGAEAFSCCTNLIVPDIPANVTYIGKQCFYACEPNNNWTLNDGDQPLELAEECFRGASIKLTYIGRNLVWLGGVTDSDIIGDHLIIGEYATDFSWFQPSQFSNLDQIVCEANVIPTIGRFSENQYNYTIVYVPESMLSSYKADSNWGFFKELYGLNRPANEYEIIPEPSELTIDVGETADCSASLSPFAYTYLNMNCSSWDIVSIPEFGKVYGLKAGDADIIFMSYLNNKTATCHVKVIQPATNVLINHTSVDLRKGEQFQLMANVMPADAYDSSLTWSSDNENVATVDENGLVTAINGGTCSIKATAYNGVTGTCQINVNVPVESISITPSMIEAKEGERQYLSVTYYPTDATNKDVMWSSSDRSVATVSNSGYVTIKGVGSATITAAVKDNPSVVAQCHVLGLSSLEEIEALISSDADLFSIDGALIKRGITVDELPHLEKGLYILKSRTQTKTILIN